ncbi:MAG: hypothetical protein J5629_05105 [Muribaculaceae bacterium]|nr:hypothetical protein [Muribaculaceae bacterium]
MTEKNKEAINIDYTNRQNRVVNSLNSGLKRLTIEIGFVIMVISAICTVSSIGDVMRGSLAGTLCLALINTVGMVIIYYAMMRGMRPLYRPLKSMWIILIALNLIGFVTTFLILIDESLVIIDLVLAALLLMAYLPMGVFLIMWYDGKLGRLGAWMIARIIIVVLLPIAWILLLGGTLLPLLDVIVLAIELIYAYMLRDILISKEERGEC